MKIEFVNYTGFNLEIYYRGIENTLAFNVGESLSIIFIDEESMQKKNFEYRNKDYVTDVLSFPDDSGFSYLGDVFICPAKAFSQAKEYGHSEFREIVFLAVHGFLHLKGYDHNNIEEEKIMFEKQEEILKKANVER